MFRRPELSSLGTRLAKEVLRQIEEAGFDGVRVADVAGVLGVGVGTLYNRWGARDSLFEHTWRTCVASLEHETTQALVFVTPTSHALAFLCERFRFALPDHLDGFFELHAARRRWQRADVDNDGSVIPSLLTYVELNQRFGHFRAGPSRMLAGVIWWVCIGALHGAGRFDSHRLTWCVEALRRAILTTERLAAEDPIETLDISVEDPAAPNEPPLVFASR